MRAVVKAESWDNLVQKYKKRASHNKMSNSQNTTDSEKQNQSKISRELHLNKQKIAKEQLMADITGKSNRVDQHEQGRRVQLVADMKVEEAAEQTARADALVKARAEQEALEAEDTRRKNARITADEKLTTAEAA